MRFSEALELCLEGKKIRNGRWNGKNAFVYYVPGRMLPVSMWKECNGPLTEEEKSRGQVEIIGHLDMATADGKRIIGWLASQYDLMSEDWEVYESEAERKKRIEEADKLIDELDKEGFFDKVKGE